MAVDLDAVQTRYDDGRISSDPAIAFAAIDDVPALVAELRAAREVIEIARHADAPGLRAAIHAYDWHAPEEPTP